MLAVEDFGGWETAVAFYPFPSTGSHGAEPDAKTATNNGVRVASMPGFTHYMLAIDGPMAVDYQQVAADCQKFADLLSATNEVNELCFVISESDICY